MKIKIKFSNHVIGEKNNMSAKLEEMISYHTWFVSVRVLIIFNSLPQGDCWVWRKLYSWGVMGGFHTYWQQPWRVQRAEGYNRASPWLIAHWDTGLLWAEEIKNQISFFFFRKPPSKGHRSLNPINQKPLALRKSQTKNLESRWITAVLHWNASTLFQ